MKRLTATGNLLQKYSGRYRVLVCCLCIWLVPARLAAAQKSATTRPEPAATEGSEEDPLGRLTPYGCVWGFLRAARGEDYTLAVQYLDTKVSADKAQELARQLRTVLDFATSVNLDGLSKSPEGDLGDGLAINRDRIGLLEIGSKEFEILVERVQRGKQPRIWLFSSATLRIVPEAFERTRSLDFRKYLPRPLVEIKVFSIPLWRWISMVIGLALALGLASLVRRALMVVLRPLIRRVTGKEDERRLISLTAPLRVVLLAIAIALLSSFGISVLARHFWGHVAVALAVLGLAWLLIQLSDIVSELGTRHLQRVQMSGKLAMIALVRRLFKTAVLVTSALVILYIAGVDLTPVLAGLGVGGVAVAFAAQKTIENLFGGISIISDEPIRVGDFCRVADQIGTVEDIGIRSTRIRTLDRTVVSIPNGQLAATNLENFSIRDKFWCHPRIGVRYETTADQLRNVLADITAMLLSHPKVEPESARVRFIGFGNSSLDIDIFTYVKETEMTPFLTVQEDLLLRIMDIIDANGTQVAFPSQTIYFAEDNCPDSAGGGRTIATLLQSRGLREPIAEAGSTEDSPKG